MTVQDELKHQVKQMGQILGRTIAQAKGEPWLQQVERIRTWGKAARDGDQAARDAMETAFGEMTNDDLLTAARAFSQFLNLVNIAEQHHTVSPAGLLEQDHPNPLVDVLSRLQAENLSPKAQQQAVDQLHIELVLTAHPTEVTRRTLIHKYGELAGQLDRWQGDPEDRTVRTAQRRIEELVSQAWHTEEIRSARPTPVDEARWGFAVIENSLWDAVPGFIREFEEALADHNLTLPLDARPLTFCSWMGGDRDGNPNVTAQVTEEVLLLARWKAAELFSADVHALASELSMSACTEQLKTMAGSTREPYRAVLKSLRDRLTLVQQAISERLSSKVSAHKRPALADCLLSDDALLTPLQACYDSLCACGMQVIANGALKDSLRRAHAFGASLLRLDVRQHSERHLKALDEVTRYLSVGEYADWSEAEKQSFLLRELSSHRPLLPRQWTMFSEETREVLKTNQVISQFPRESFGLYIISMASQASDVLAVQLLLREADVDWSMPVAPLFETLDDLNGAPDTFQALLDIPWYREYCAGHQHVMIGYSDSAKDAGVLAASWAQYRAQEALVNKAADHDMTLTLFHGRGGSIGRGGGPAHAAILSQPPGSVTGGLRVTEQGETIRFKFGLPDLAIRSLHLYASAMLEALLLPPPEPEPEWRTLMDELADTSCGLYRDVVRYNDDFVPFFRAATPEQELSKLPLGSRPAKRNPDGGVESLRAIPWIFAWSQNRMLLPSWLGAVEAIRPRQNSPAADTLQAMSTGWPFFASRLAMLEMVFMKTDATLSSAYARRLVPEALQPLADDLTERLEQDASALKALLSEDHLMRGDRWNRDSILLREPYLEPLHWLQIELLERDRAAAEQGLPEHEVALIEKALMVTIAGIAAGMRNTG